MGKSVRKTSVDVNLSIGEAADMSMFNVKVGGSHDEPRKEKTMLLEEAGKMLW